MRSTNLVKLIPGGNLNENEGKFYAIFEQASDAILTLNNQTIDEVNLAFEELCGHPKSELLQQNISTLFPTPGDHHIPERSKPFNIDFLENPGTYEDVALLQKDGLIRLIDLTVRVIKRKNQDLTILIARDLTEKKRMERELITKHNELKNTYIQLEKSNTELKAMQETLVQAGKMAALGELAAGIAHELNQPLQGIKGYSQELTAVLEPHLKGKKDEQEIQSFLNEIISNSDKMAAIISHLRTFTRKSTEDFTHTSVHDAIDEALKMLSRQLSSRGITVEKNLKKPISNVFANPLQLEQVFINLTTNARDAIEATQRGKGEIKIQTQEQGEFVEVRFSDNGCGMNEKTKTKIFNPFFTTKEVGKGMGLGLSLSYGMLSKIHASVVVESELGKGTTFVIRIPKDFREINS